MAIKVSGTTVIDDSRNLTNVGNINGKSPTIIDSSGVASFIEKGYMELLGSTAPVGAQYLKIFDHTFSAGDTWSAKIELNMRQQNTGGSTAPDYLVLYFDGYWSGSGNLPVFNLSCNHGDYEYSTFNYSDITSRYTTSGRLQIFARSSSTDYLCYGRLINLIQATNSGGTYDLVQLPSLQTGNTWQSTTDPDGIGGTTATGDLRDILIDGITATSVTATTVSSTYLYPTYYSRHNDHIEAYFGTGNDTYFYHNGSNLILELTSSATNDFYVTTGGYARIQFDRSNNRLLAVGSGSIRANELDTTNDTTSSDFIVPFVGTTSSGGSGDVLSNSSLTFKPSDGTLSTDRLVVADSAYGPGGIALGATGGGTDQVFFMNQTHITTDFTLGDSNNAGTFGPVTVDSGVTVTINSGSRWTVV